MRGIETARLLLEHVEAVPVTAEILDLTGRELEPRAELAVLEEDVCVAKARGVEVLPLAFLRQDSLDALYSSVRSWDASRGERSFEVPWNSASLFSGVVLSSTVPTPLACARSMIFWDI